MPPPCFLPCTAVWLPQRAAPRERLLQSTPDTPLLSLHHHHYITFCLQRRARPDAGSGGHHRAVLGEGGRQLGWCVGKCRLSAHAPRPLAPQRQLFAPFAAPTAPRARLFQPPSSACCSMCFAALLLPSLSSMTRGAACPHPKTHPKTHPTPHTHPPTEVFSDQLCPAGGAHLPSGNVRVLHWRAGAGVAAGGHRCALPGADGWGGHGRAGRRSGLGHGAEGVGWGGGLPHPRRREGALPACQELLAG